MPDTTSPELELHTASIIDGPEDPDEDPTEEDVPSPDEGDEDAPEPAEE